MDRRVSESFRSFLPENPHVRYFESRARGYVRVEATPAIWRADLRAVSTIVQLQAQARTLTSWVVESGRAGAQPA